MFKNMLKRAWLSTIRKPTRSIILAALFFVMANMILATVVIQSSVSKSIDYAKETLSGIVYLQPDMEAVREKAMANMQNQNQQPGQPFSVRMIRPDIPVDMVNDIANSEYVKDYTYSINGRADANGFDPIESDNSMGGMIMGGNGSVSRGRSIGNMSVLGINSFAFIAGVDSGDVKLAEGSIFDETTNNSVMISYDLASENGLKVGDTIKLDTVSIDEEVVIKTIDLTIIGIYDTTVDNADANTIYMNTETAAQFSIENGGEVSENYSVQNVKYYLTNAEYKDAFIAEANQKYPDLADKDLLLNIDDSAYQQMAGPIESVGSFAAIILIIVVIASVAIITLIVTINIKDRRYEMGVLLSLGATRKNIIGQIALELVAVATVGLILSIGTSTFLAQAMGSNMLTSQISMNEQRAANNFGRGMNAGPQGGGMTTQRMGGGPIMFGGSVSDAEPIDEIDISASWNDYLILFISSYVIIAVSLIIPSINILRYQPKTILTGKE